MIYIILMILFVYALGAWLLADMWVRYKDRHIFYGIIIFSVMTCVAMLATFAFDNLKKGCPQYEKVEDVYRLKE